METHGPEILTALAIAGILALFRIAWKVGQLDQAIRGLDGKNGLVGKVEEFRTWRHEEAIPAQQKNLLRLQRLEQVANLPPLES